MISYNEVTGERGEICEAAVREKYEKLTKSLIEKGITITTMESCTCGQIASLITDTEGASAILKGACITYSNEAKIMEGVSEKTIKDYGVYSPETACEMAKVCREKYSADIGIGVTGSFGNVDPDNADSIPGEVFFSIAKRDGAFNYHCNVPPQNSRLDYKLYMADIIVDNISI